MSWEIRKLGEVLSVLKNGINCKQNKDGVGDKISRIETISDKIINYKKTGFSQLTNDQKEKAKLESGDILFSHINSPIHVGKTAIYQGEEDLYHGINLLLMRTIKAVNPQYFNYFLKNLFSSGYWKENCKQAVNQASVNQQDIKKIEISYPPLPVQKQIVAKLDAAFADIDKAHVATQKNIENAEALFQRYLNNVFETTDIQWMENSLSEFCNIKHGYAFSGKDFEVSDDEALPIVLTPGNYTEEGTLHFTPKNTKRLVSEVEEQWVLETGNLTVVMTDLSSKMKLLGKPAFIDKNNILHNQRIGLIEFKKPSLKPEFLYYFFMSKNYLDMVKRTSTGSMVRHTAPKRILAANIRFPKELAAQERITAKLDNLSNQKNLLRQVYLKKIRQLENLKSSILKQAFSGELIKAAA